MKQTPGSTDAVSANTRHSGDATSAWDLADADFIEMFEAREGCYRVTYDPCRATPSVAIVAIISNITGKGPLELDPIYESIDSDALDALFTRKRPSVCRLTFQYNGFEITVGTDAIIEVVAW